MAKIVKPEVTFGDLKPGVVITVLDTAPVSAPMRGKTVTIIRVLGNGVFADLGGRTVILHLRWGTKTRPGDLKYTIVSA